MHITVPKPDCTQRHHSNLSATSQNLDCGTRNGSYSRLNPLVRVFLATKRRSCDVAELRLTTCAANKKEVFKMATQGLSASRIILAGGFAVAALATPAVITLAASHTTTTFGACASGESEDIYTNVC